MKPFFKSFVALSMLLCLLPVISHAEIVQLAFGYEIELPEGVKITNEVWNPSDLDLIYLLEGTYADGKEVFEMVWCDVSQRPAHVVSNRIVDSYNYASDNLWGSLLGSTYVSGNYEGAVFEMVSQQMTDFSVALENALYGNQDYQETSDSMTFKRIPIVELEAYADLDEGQIDIQNNMRVGYGNGRLVVTNENGQTLLWVSQLPNINFHRYASENSEILLDEMILSFSNALESVGLWANNYDISRETLKENAWVGSRAEYCITAPAKEGTGFATLKAFSSGAEIVIYEGGSTAEEAMAMTHSAVIFFKGQQNEKTLIPSGSYVADAYSNTITIPLANGQYTVSIADRFTDIPADKRQFEEIEYEGGIKSSYGYTNEYDFFTELLTYQYLPMPDEFQKNTMIMSDEEYLSQIEKAFQYLGGQHLDILKEVIVPNSNAELTLEIAKEEGARMADTIDQALNQPMNAEQMFSGSIEDYLKLNKARAIAEYFVPIDRNRIKTERLAWNAGGRRWVLTRNVDLFGEDSINGYGAIALFDGALHLIETPDYVNATFTFRPNYEGVQSVTSQESESAVQAQSNGARAAIVATKSSPLTLREAPGNGGTKIMSIPKGETVYVLEEGEWPLIEYKGKQGYVNGQYLK